MKDEDLVFKGTANKRIVINERCRSRVRKTSKKAFSWWIAHFPHLETRISALTIINGALDRSYPT